MTAPPSLAGTIVDGRYRLGRLLRESSLGATYAAEHVAIAKAFAIKLLRPELAANRDAIRRFVQEARLCASARHRNVVAIEDFGTLPGGVPYTCMEALDGAMLAELVAEPMTADRLLAILIGAGHGLAAVHARGVVHRGVTPDSIFVTRDDVAKLVDLEIAKVVAATGDAGPGQTRPGTIFGTPWYMAPEQALGNTVDARTDVYAVGVIAYEVFAGSLPFGGETNLAVLTQHITVEPEPVEQRTASAGRTLPTGLTEVITRALRKEPGERFQSAAELVDALESVRRTL